MNHLAHFHLAGDDAELVVGGFLGDFIKGRLPVEAPLAFDRGIRLHRAIDAFTDQHPLVRCAQRRFSATMRRFAPIITDVAFDHFLAQHWSAFHSVPLVPFSRQTYATVITAEAHLPERARQLIRAMRQHQSLENYGSRAFVERALTHLSARLKRANPLVAGFREFEDLSIELESDFLEFYPLMLAHARQWQASHPGRIIAE